MESHHTTSVISVFDVWEIRDVTWRKPHYPCYEVREHKVGSALSLEDAERIVREGARRRDLSDGRPAHSYRIDEMPLGRFAYPVQYLSEYIYDSSGIRIDERLFPSQDGVFEGRPADRVRFREGDLCEVLDADAGTVHLGFVAALPPSVEQAARINGGVFKMDALDDCYLVMNDETGDSHEHADALRVFRPRFSIHPAVERRLRRAYADSLTFARRMEIYDITAGERLRALAQEMGWDVRIERPAWHRDTFKLLLDGVPGFPGGLDLQIRQQVAWDHMDRIRISFLRLSGRPARGRGYRLKRLDPTENRYRF
ncbi:MAG: hypothetical protein II518_05220 [Candidatus Methanomethylophilus sp.]|nr:hypothetical protein [Methanomethylophilus sp.]